MRKLYLLCCFQLPVIFLYSQQQQNEKDTVAHTNGHRPLSNIMAGFVHRNTSQLSAGPNVGIGTATPQAKLDVVGDIAINDNILRLRDGNDGNHGLKYDATIDGPYLFGFNGGALGTAGQPNSLTWDYNGNATVRSALTVGSGITVDYNNLNTGTTLNKLSFGSGGDAGIGSNRSGGGVNNNGLDFYTNNTKRMLIDNNGVVGIGTSYPANFSDYKLSVAGTTTVDYGNQNNGTIANVLNFGSSGGAAIGSNRSGFGSNDHGLDFYTSGNKQMSLNTAGQLGIGTAVPAAKLDVEGDVKIADGTQGAGKILTSDANGKAYWNNPPAKQVSFMSLRISSYSISSGATIPFDSIVVNIGNAFATNGVFTVPSDGFYFFSAMIMVEAGGTVNSGNQHYLSIFKLPQQPTNSLGYYSVDASGPFKRDLISYNTVSYLTAGAQVALKVYSDVASSYVDIDSRFYGYKIY